MGCSGSKFGSEAESVPAKLRPLLLLRFEEMRRWRHGVSLKDNDSATLSKKELLKDDLISDSDNSSHPRDFDHKSISSQEDHSLKIAPAPESDETAPKNKIDPNKVAKTAPLLLMSPYKDVNHKAVEAPLPAGSPRVSDKTRKEKNIQQDCKDENKEKEAEVKAVEAMPDVEEMEATETAGDENGEEEDGTLSSLTQKCDGPGSPSFRVYFIESLDNIKEDGIVKDDDGDDDDEGSEKKSECEDSPATIEFTNAGSETKTKNKGKKGIRLRRVIPKGRSGAVMNLLNVRSCYTACTRHDNANLLAEKAAA
ncbi:hypothetical protein P3X46_030805 [Hevea brasiliensis]|uniref:Uncharacterized protein n=1 Tax=Hevea brasiliensis TaxID=3981 RepID=A0ABQ9KIA8_HEVBR|nr:uncharacterized protein LOC110637709 [Hevea brasiliensis]KAJ9140123.1 hypothetical protein P3X46_030805 [Hevea brasiliensis]